MPTIVIIGGGFCGTMTAVHLLRGVSADRSAAARGLEIVLIERRPPAGRGPAYRTQCMSHLLNVPAARMSALPDRPAHFLEWARTRDASIAEGDYLPRAWYGEYLSAMLHEAEQAAAPFGRLVRIDGDAVDIQVAERSAKLPATPRAASPAAVREAISPCSVRLTDGRSIRADRVVLAVGNAAPGDLPLADPDGVLDKHLVRDPWSDAASHIAPSDAPVLLVGTGLTMLDAVLSLDDSGHRGPITAISRHGLLPQIHARPATQHPPAMPPAAPDAAALAAELAGERGRTALGALKSIRRAAQSAVAAGGDWRAVIDSVRPMTQQFWKRWSVQERRRFIHRPRAYWEVHRHRVAPQIAHRIGALVGSGRLKIIAGRLMEIRGVEHEASVDIRFRRRGAAESEIVRVARVVNCTGPRSNYGCIDDPLVQSLRTGGLLVPDELGLGVQTHEHGALLDAERRPSRVLYTLGPPRKPQLWESTAVPELREQAAALASRLLFANS